MTTAIIEAKLRELHDARFLRDEEKRAIARAIASALADARRADVELVRLGLTLAEGESYCDSETCPRWCGDVARAKAALSRLAGET